MATTSNDQQKNSKLWFVKYPMPAAATVILILLAAWLYPSLTGIQWIGTFAAIVAVGILLRSHILRQQTQLGYQLRDIAIKLAPLLPNDEARRDIKSNSDVNALARHIDQALDQFTRTNEFLEGVSSSLATHAHSMNDTSEQITLDLSQQKNGNRRCP